MKEILKRMKSKIFWIELVLLVAQVGKLTGLYSIDNEMLSALQDLITILFTIFATLNDPTQTKKF